MATQDKPKSEGQRAARVMAKHLKQAKAAAHAVVSCESREKSAKGVHDLRVALRRLGVAAKVFAFMLPDKAEKKLRRKARRLRRNAGKLRDDDALRAAVEAFATEQPAHSAAAAFITKHTKRARPALVKALRHEAKELDKEHFWRWAETKVVEKLAAARDQQPGLERLAAGVIPRQVSVLRESLDTARGGPDEALHAARIAGKRVRYALDLFNDCFVIAPGAEVHPVALRLQELLGEIHDDAVFAERCRAYAANKELLTSERGALRRLATALSRRRRERVRDFSAYCLEQEDLLQQAAQIMKAEQEQAATTEDEETEAALLH